MSSYPQIAVQRWDASLGLEWSRQFSFGNYHLLSSVNELSDGGLLFTGSVRLSSGSGPFFPFILKVDTLGQVVWSRRSLNSLQLLNDVVEMADGSFLAVGQTWASEPLIAHLDSVGGLIDARLSTSTGTGVPTELIHDTIANEFLVRFRALPKLVRLDATLQLDCDELPYTWPDTLVWPSAFDFPITQTMGSMLVNFDSVVVSQPIFMTAYDPCLGTTVADSDPRSPLSAWPMPTSGSLTIGPLNGSLERATYRLVDALGRVMLYGSAPADRSELVLDLGALVAGRYVLVLDVGGNQERIQVMKL